MYTLSGSLNCSIGWVFHSDYEYCNRPDSSRDKQPLEGWIHLQLNKAQMKLQV